MPFSPDLLVSDPLSVAKIHRDRRYLEYALEQAGQWLQHAPRIDGEGCRCPFHDDQKPSGSIHQDVHNRIWLFTCHGCRTLGGEWNQQNPKNPSNSGDAIAVLRAAADRAGRPLTFAAACQHLVDAVEIPAAPANAPTVIQFPGAAQIHDNDDEIAAAEEEVCAAHQNLKTNVELLDRLWKTRAINRATVEQFRLGYLNDGMRHWWVFPIHHADGRFMAQKRHAADGAEPKSRWAPKGAKNGRPLFPLSLTTSGTVWLCGGELRALAAVSAGLPAVGWTAGETTMQLPPALLDRLRNRTVGIVPDNDDTGRNWANAVAAQLAAVGIDVRIVDLGLQNPHDDLGDWLVEQQIQHGNAPADVQAKLQAAIDQTPPVTADEAPHEQSAAATNAGGTNADTASSTATSTNATTSTVTGSTATPGATTGPTPPTPPSFIHSLGDIWKNSATWQPVERVSTGIDRLDSALGGGLATGAVHMLCGKAGNGKTQFALQVALNAARNGVPVGLLSLEMSRATIGRLALAQLSGVARKTIDAGLRTIPTLQQQQYLHQAMQQYAPLRLDVVDADAIDGPIDRQIVADIVDQGGTRREWKLIVLDHIGELAPLPNEIGQPLHVDAQNASVLRHLARQFQAAILVVAPLRKAAKSSAKKVPHTENAFHLDDLLGSTTLGYQAHSCLALRADVPPAPQQPALLVEFLKVRDAAAPDKPLKLTWTPACGQVR